ncbi:8557_t:CDS:2 [Entrophospora sp. SA101]|nr:8557_t:CDS:2 [Entrophospora sp. SA101]
MFSSSSSPSTNTTTNKDEVGIDPMEEEAKVKRKFNKWRKSIKYITGIGLTEQEKEQYKIELERDFKEYECNRCEKIRDSLMRNSPIIIFMLKSLEEIGYKLDKNHFKCLPCDETRSGGFSPELGILLCQNRFLNRRHQEDTMAHEMIHLYDHCRFKIRAASLSGDCRWTREIRRGFFGFAKQHQACTKRRAILSLKQNASCSAPGVAEKAVAEVFESCFNDTRPFDEIY